MTYTKNVKITVPKPAKMIIEKLMEHGYDAYVVGGCVRDSVLGSEPHDWDITTSALPEEVKAIFGRTIDTGIKHGTVTIMVDREGYEVTTYRVDGEYRDHRRPESVTFTRTLEEDLKRRDFTINAMAYNDRDGLIDLYDGIGDLNKGVIRCVGVADERFDEDALRMLRAVRFAAKLGFEIDEETRAAVKRHAKFLKDISAERIREELTKIITSDHPEYIEIAYELGLTAEFLPEFDIAMQTPQVNKHHMYDVGHHIIKVMCGVPNDVVLRYTALLHDIGKPATRTTEDGRDHFYGHPEVGAKMTETILKRLKMDNDTIRDVKKLVLWHDYGIKNDNMTMYEFRKAMSELGIEYFERLAAIRYADLMGQSLYKRERKIENCEEFKRKFKVVMAEKQCVRLKDMAITGDDLKALGVKSGPFMGELLKKLFDIVLMEPEKNNHDILTEIAMDLINQKN